MPDRAERIAAWYLRFNGFFLIDSFVVHRENGRGNSTEIDLLGLRPPHVYEELGGRADDWDNTFISQEDRELFIGVICEVKRGPNYKPKSVFRPREIRYVVRRFGILNEEEAHTAATELENQKSVFIPNKKLQIRKLLIADLLKPRVPPCQYKEFRDTYQFSQNRIRKYYDEKNEARILFDSYNIDEWIDHV